MPSTGRRDITDLVTSGEVQDGSIVVYRIGSIVTITTRDFRVEGTGWKKLLTLPNGLRPLVTVESSAWWTTSGGLYQCLADESGRIALMHPGGSETIRGHFTYATEDPWPTALPGSPV